MNTERLVDESSSDFDDLMLQIDAACLRFETNWSPDSAVSKVAGLLSEFSSEKVKSRVFRELVATDCELRTRRRMELIPDAFANEYPLYNEEVRTAVELWKETETSFRRDQDQARFDSLPTQIGDYTIVREVGRGGSSVVFEAIQPELDRRVALKTFVLNPVRSLEQRQRFALEVKAASLLEHEHIVSVYHSGEGEGLLYYAMQFVDGVSLHHLIREHADLKLQKPESSGSDELSWKLGPNRVAQMISQATLALDYAHQQGVLHRDIKPSNLLLDQSGNVRLADFGLAQLAGSDSQLTATGNVVGSLRYLPPEAFDGVRDVRGDVYGLGLTLYELLTLEPAFPEKDRSKLIPQIQEFSVRSPRQIDRTIPRDLETITMKAMAPDASDRYASARELGSDLRRFLAGEPIQARPVTWVERGSKWLWRRPGVAALSALVGAFLLIGLPAFLLMWQGRELDRVRASRELAEVKLSEERASTIADRERARAEGASEARADAEYAMLINFSQRSIDNGDYRAAVQRMNRYVEELERSPAQGQSTLHRLGWEWFYLLGLLDQAKITISSDPSLVSKLCLSPDEESFLTVGHYVGGQNLVSGNVKLRDASTGKLIKSFAKSNEIFSDAAFSSDGSTLATISLHHEESEVTGWVRVWDVDSGKELRSRKLVDDFPEKMLERPGLKRRLPQIQFDHSGTMLITSAPVIAFDVQTLEPKWKQDGDRVYSLGDDEVAIFRDTQVRRHDVKTGEPLAEGFQTFSPTDFSRRPKELHTLHVGISPKNQSYCLIRDDQFRKVDSCVIPRSYWTSFTPDGKSLIRSEIRGDMVIQAFENGAKVTKRLVGHQSPVHHGVFNRAGDRLITAGQSGTIKIWELDKVSANKVTFDIPDVAGQTVEALSFNAACDRIHFAASSFYKRKLCGSAQVDGSDLKNFELDTTNFIYWPRNDIGYSPDGSLLAAPAREDKRPESNHRLIRPSSSGRINIWSTDDTDEVLQTVELGGGSFVSGVAFSQNNQLLAIAVRKKEGQERKSSIALVTVGEASDVPIRWLPVSEDVSCLKFVRDDQSLVYSEDSGGVVVLPIDGDGEPQRIADAPLPEKPSSSVVDVDSSGTRMAVMSIHRQSVRVYDIPSQTMMYEASLAMSPCSVCFSPDGNRLAVAGQNSIVRLLDTESGHTLLTLDGRSDVRQAAPGTSIKVVFSSDGRQIATQGLDGRINVWNCFKNGKD